MYAIVLHRFRGPLGLHEPLEGGEVGYLMIGPTRLDPFGSRKIAP